MELEPENISCKCTIHTNLKSIILQTNYATNLVQGTY